MVAMDTPQHKLPQLAIVAWERKHIRSDHFIPILDFWWMVQTSAVRMLLWLPGTQSAGRIWIISHEYDWGWWWLIEQPCMICSNYFRQPILDQHAWIPKALPHSINSINHPMHQYSIPPRLFGHITDEDGLPHFITHFAPFCNHRPLP